MSGMKRIALAALAFTALAGCELVTIGTKPVRQLNDIDQTTAVGVVSLFKAEIDSNNIAAASRIFASDERRPLLAIEKFDMKFEIARLGRQIAHMPVTNIAVDTLTSERFRLLAEFDYVKQLTFITVKFDNRWYISSIQE